MDYEFEKNSSLTRIKDDKRLENEDEENRRVRKMKNELEAEV